MSYVNRLVANKMFSPSRQITANEVAFLPGNFNGLDRESLTTLFHQINSSKGGYLAVCASSSGDQVVARVGLAGYVWQNNPFRAVLKTCRGQEDAKIALVLGKMFYAVYMTRNGGQADYRLEMEAQKAYRLIESEEMGEFPQIIQIARGALDLVEGKPHPSLSGEEIERMLCTLSQSIISQNCGFSTFTYHKLNVMIQKTFPLEELLEEVTIARNMRDDAWLAELIVEKFVTGGMRDWLNGNQGYDSSSSRSNQSWGIWNIGSFRGQEVTPDQIRWDKAMIALFRVAREAGKSLGVRKCLTREFEKVKNEFQRGYYASSAGHMKSLRTLVVYAELCRQGWLPAAEWIAQFPALEEGQFDAAEAQTNEAAQNLIASLIEELRNERVREMDSKVKALLELGEQLDQSIEDKEALQAVVAQVIADLNMRFPGADLDRNEIRNMNQLFHALLHVVSATEFRNKRGELIEGSEEDLLIVTQRGEVSVDGAEALLRENVFSYMYAALQSRDTPTAAQLASVIDQSGVLRCLFF